MSQKFKPRLAKINPSQAEVRGSALRPTWWDKRAVQDDLTYYVSLARLVPGTPALSVFEGALVVKSGLPFLRAAQQAIPPLKEIICQVDASDEDFKELNLEEVNVSELLDKYPTSEVYESLQMLVFSRSLNAGERQVVEQVIMSFFAEMVNHPEYGGKYHSMGKLKWNDIKTRIIWTWQSCDEEGQHKVRLVEALKKLDSDLTPIRSWNGLIFSYNRYPEDYSNS